MSANLSDILPTALFDNMLVILWLIHEQDLISLPTNKHFQELSRKGMSGEGTQSFMQSLFLFLPSEPLRWSIPLKYCFSFWTKPNPCHIQGAFNPNNKYTKRLHSFIHLRFLKFI